MITLYITSTTPYAGKSALCVGLGKRFQRDGYKVGYMRPLVTGPLCLTCHGPVERIPPPVRQLLAQRYPGDRATGFTAGSVRGAVSVRIELPSAGAR